MMAGSSCFTSLLCPSRLFLLLLLVESFYIALETALGPGWGAWPSFGNLEGCRQDGEGSWSIGIYKGPHPWALVPLENVVPRIDTAAAWPVANPVLTCASVSDAPSNFVADPFLFQGSNGVLYLFYETKNSDTQQGDIGVAESRDGGASWQHLAVVLDEPWHLSYPFVFEHEGEIYMMPEGSSHGDLRLYRALSFPTRWAFDRVVLKRPMVDASLLSHNGSWYLFSADKTRPGVARNAFLEIWHSSSPLGPWEPHRQNPFLYEDRSMGARMAGRPFSDGVNLYRFGQDCGITYGGAVRAFRIDALSPDEFAETEVSWFGPPQKGGKLWNGVRHHHVDVQRLPSGDWIAAVDGDHVPSGAKSRVFLRGLLCAIGFCVLNTLLLAACKAVPLHRSAKTLLRRMWGLHRALPGHFPSGHYSPNGSYHNVAAFKGGLVRSNSGGITHRLVSSPLLCWPFPSLQTLRPPLLPKGKGASGAQWRRYTAYLCLGAVLVCSGLLVLGVGELFYSLLGNSSSNMPYPVHGQFSKFSLLCMSYDARIANLKLFVRHYSRCSSVGEIVIIWNHGLVPNLTEFDSAAPLRIRAEEVNSLNNRFRPDPLIRNRGVMELDDDVWMSCGDLERGFAHWRRHPERIVGYYPRLADGKPLTYRGEQYAFERGRYNVVLTGAAFLDSETAFPLYFSEDYRRVREIVDDLFNCEDLALNYVLGMRAREHTTIEYVRPNLRVDLSKVSSVGISRNSEEHARRRSQCLQRLAQHFGREAPLESRRLRAPRPNYFPALSPWRESAWGWKSEGHFEGRKHGHRGHGEHRWHGEHGWHGARGGNV